MAVLLAPAPAHVALFPLGVRNVLVVVDRVRDARGIAEKLARMHEREPVRIHLLAVELAPSGHAMAFLKGIDVKRVLLEDGMKTLRPLMELLDAAGVPYRHDVEIGRWEETVARYAQERCCKSILVGGGESSLLARLFARHDARRIRTRLRRQGFACQLL